MTRRPRKQQEKQTQPAIAGEPSLELEQERLEFEREKHRDEIALRIRELDLKNAQQQQFAWRSPLFVAVVAACAGLFSNAMVALINGSSQRAIEQQEANHAQTMAELTAEGNLVLEAIKTGGPDKAADNLELLVKTGLVTKGADQILAYLKERKPGEGASLPASSVLAIGTPSPSRFVRLNLTGPLTEDLKSMLVSDAALEFPAALQLTSALAVGLSLGFTTDEPVPNGVVSIVLERTSAEMLLSAIALGLSIADHDPQQKQVKPVLAESVRANVAIAVKQSVENNDK